MPISEIYTLVYGSNRHLLSADHLPSSALHTLVAIVPTQWVFNVIRQARQLRQTQRKKMTNACRGDRIAFFSFATPCGAHCGVFAQGS